LLDVYDYSAALGILKDLPASRSLSDEMNRRLLRAIGLCNCLVLWDRFDHKAAADQSDQLKEVSPKHWMWLQRVCASRSALDEAFFAAGEADVEHHRYELVEDLLLNAQRREKQGRYDDAMGRLYRALEMLGQALYKFSDGKETDSSLRQIFEVDLVPTCPRAAEMFREAKVAEQLEKRNKSLLAHGMRPVTREQYDEAKAVIAGYIRNTLAAELGHRAYTPMVDNFPTDFAR
jgi:tetratricopeptide (TPR) repeat protein